MNLTPLNVLVTVLVLAIAAGVVIGCTRRPASSAAAAVDGDQTTFVGRVYDESGKLADPAPLAKVARTDDEWKTQLTPDRYRILRKQGTERAFTGALLENKSPGVYRCAGCDLPLYASDTKFKSGTGWPSFYQPIADGNVATKSDRSFGTVRTEILCGRCDGHLGHVFNDGPQPTGQRHCVNSASLEFTPKADLATLAEPAAVRDQPTTSPDAAASAVFAGGCFWCVEAVFEELDGVKDAISGYAGGTADTANYKAVCSGRTKHAEAVRIVYDPKKIAYEDLLRVHFATHDPTTLNRQGADVGPQYRSAIFYADEREQALARAFIEDLGDQKSYGSRRVVTTLEPLTKFYPAEQYHQNYVCQNPSQGYVRGVALPKVKKVRKQFESMLKDESPLDRSRRN
ncbi:MAG: bifunctional methionine sulfoxide reductase B/A protein [Planctomycetes bacterium]|nr:bifunctional methionine sulfoxide reductase B/A protein [Planctomycetota bacterium]